MRWIIGIVAVMVIYHLWMRWSARRELRRAAREAEPETPPANGDAAPPRDGS